MNTRCFSIAMVFACPWYSFAHGIWFNGLFWLRCKLCITNTWALIHGQKEYKYTHAYAHSNGSTHTRIIIDVPPLFLSFHLESSVSVYTCYSLLNWRMKRTSNIFNRNRFHQMKQKKKKHTVSIQHTHTHSIFIPSHNFCC